MKTRFSRFCGITRNIAVSLSAALVTVWNSNAHACPGINGVPDINCDGKAIVTVMGDSLAYGFGDTANQNRGGYVLRAAKALPKVIFHNHGEQGLISAELIESIDKAFSGSDEKLRDDLVASDIVVFDIGRNDRWLDIPPRSTLKALKLARTKIQNEVGARTGFSPLVVFAVLMLPNRSAQGPWVKQFDELVLKGSSPKHPADLRFDLVSKRLLSSDQIHPTPAGYKALAQVFVKYITKTLTARVKQIYPDGDSDGLSNILETGKFGTDPQLADTDGDGVVDGTEVLEGRNPLFAEVPAM
jgi:lysophospholipase L1-like esterase